MWSACFTSCATGEKTQGISAEAQRRFDYYYAEAVKSKLAGRYDDSFELYKHCLDIKPDAAEALYNLGLYYLGFVVSARCASHLSRAVALEPENIYYKEALASFYLRNRDDVNTRRQILGVSRSTVSSWRISFHRQLFRMRWKNR